MEGAMTIALVIANKGASIVSVDAAQSVREVVALLADRRIGAVPVLRDGVVAGIFSERDVVYGLERDGEALLSMPVGQVMTTPAITIDPGESVLVALSMMTRRRIRHLPVIDGDRLIGFVSIGDLVKYRIDGIEREAEALREYIQHG